MSETFRQRLARSRLQATTIHEPQGITTLRRTVRIPDIAESPSRLRFQGDRKAPKGDTCSRSDYPTAGSRKDRSSKHHRGVSAIATLPMCTNRASANLDKSRQS